MRNIAVILAGGTGSRAGGGIPKQFRTLEDGRTVFQTCVAAFEANPHIDRIAVVMLAQYMQQAQDICRACGWRKVQYWIPGGSERWESSLNAARTLSEAMQAQGEDDCNVLIHDCARPFISQDLISRVCTALLAHPAVSVALPVTDTIYTVQTDDLGERITSIPPRATLRAAQTPQAFRLSLVCKALRQAQQAANQPITDDAGAVFRLPDVHIYIVDGEPANRKLTFSEDFNRPNK